MNARRGKSSSTPHSIGRLEILEQRWKRVRELPEFLNSALDKHSTLSPDTIIWALAMAIQAIAQGDSYGNPDEGEIYFEEVPDNLGSDGERPSDDVVGEAATG